jgi:PAS domain S-box-containing protein
MILRLSLDPWLGTDRPFMLLFTVPMALAAYYGGLGPGLLSTAIAAVSTIYLMAPPRHELSFDHPLDLVSWLILLGCGVLVSALSERLRRLHTRAEHAHSETRRLRKREVESEARLHQLIDGLPQLVWTCLPNGWCDYLGQKWIEYTGAPAEQQLGYGWLEHLHPDDREKALHAWEVAVATGGTFQVEFRVRRYDGVYRHFDTRAQRVLDGDGRVIKWIGTNTDITERKNTEAALRLSEERFRQISETITHVFWITEMVPNERTVYASPAFEHIWGRRVEELYSHPRLWAESAHPDDRARVAAAFDRCLSTDGDGSYEAEFRVVRPDASQRWVRDRGRAIRDRAGHTLRIIGVAEDVTARKRAESALQLSEANLQHAQGMAHIGSQYHDLVAGSVAWSRELYRIFGLPQDTPVSQTSVLERVHPDDEPVVSQAWRRAFDGHGFDIEHRIVVGGEVKWVRTRAEVVRDGQGEPVRCLAAVQDITERKRFEIALVERSEELARSNADLEQFAYAASHDLQEPLRAVAGFVRLLEKRYTDRLDDKGREFIAFAVDGVVRMQALIDDLLAYSRVSTRGPQLEPTDATYAIIAALQNLRAAITESGGEVLYDPLPVVMADPGQLTSLFQNLIGNAIKFRAVAPPRIHVTAVKRSDDWLFCVQDNGIGIDPKYRERIFGIFQRLHTREEYAGTGIGLAICRRIAERHGGHIWVESTPGTGSTFYFTLLDAAADDLVRANQA